MRVAMNHQKTRDDLAPSPEVILRDAPDVTLRGAPDVIVRGASVRYAGAPLFENLDITLQGGQWTCLLGPSGVGKSSLLRLIAGLIPPSPGTRIEAGGQPLPGRVAWMAQQDLLLPWCDAIGNLTLGARLRGERADRAKAEAMLEAVGMSHRRDALPAALSGGERQRLALARTLMEDRPVVLMDEPFSALDAITRMEMQDLAVRLLAGRTVMLITHDPLEALRVGDTVYVLAGHPAVLQPPLRPVGPAPRDVQDPDLLALQGRLLAQLAGIDSHAALPEAAE